MANKFVRAPATRQGGGTLMREALVSALLAVAVTLTLALGIYLIGEDFAALVQARP